MYQRPFVIPLLALSVALALAGCGGGGAMPLTQKDFNAVGEQVEKATADVMVNVNTAAVEKMSDKERKLRAVRASYDIQAKAFEYAEFDYIKTLDICADEFENLKAGKADSVKITVAGGVVTAMTTIIERIPPKDGAAKPDENITDIAAHGDVSSLPPEFVKSANRILAAMKR